MTNDKYVGMDAHPASIMAEVLNANRRVVSKSIMETNPEQIRDYFRGMSGVVHVTFEEGTQPAWLYEMIVRGPTHPTAAPRRGISYTPPPGTKVPG
jgi:hypothetical protein